MRADSACWLTSAAVPIDALSTRGGEAHIASMVFRRNIGSQAVGFGGGPGGEAPIRELDRVRLLATVMGDDNIKVPMGSTGTVVAIYSQGEAYEVEFSQPVDTLATVESRQVLLVERAAE